MPGDPFGTVPENGAAPSTVAEWRDFFKGGGHEHPIFDHPGEAWPTVQDAYEWFELGYEAYVARPRGDGDGGRCGMLFALYGALNYLRASLPVPDLHLIDPL